ncbi:organic cation transporter protein isoform X2 [Agrilus planipennis]|uniref:Organic cation transporter protein isoform X2 n=1 Tax=Agrilus planipennis TaxID=224129 RepID=A0A1W4XIE8_AGRPL|nr:organic cation transporter protein isoform X2 [Agrilus planipennis]
MGYDDVVTLLGDFGRYQRRIHFLLCLPAIVCAFHKMGNVFLLAEADHRCFLDKYPNSSFILSNEILNASIPWEEEKRKYSSCSMISGDAIVPCKKYVYDHRKYQSSAIFEWNLVCDKASFSAIGDAIFMVGVGLGSIIFGYLSDKFGRKIIFFMSLVVQLLFGIICGIAPEFWTFTLSRAIVGATTSGVFLVAYVIALEMVGPTKRMVAGTVCQMFFSTGYMLTAAFAYYITDWRNLQIALTVPGVFFLCYWWFIPESARWLVSKNRVPEAVKLIQKAAKENKVNVSDQHIEMLLKDDIRSKDPNVKTATIFDVFRHPNLRRRSLIIFFDWFANSMTYYGLSWNTKNLGGNDYLNFVISGAVEIPAYTFLLFTLNRWGRKYLLCGCMITAGIALILTMAVPNSHQWLVVTLAMIGKLAITSSYGTIYVFSTEQFPTVIRNVGLGAGSTSARIGSVFAPLINFTSVAWKPLPMVIFGCMALIGGCLSLVLPETLNRKLPETIEDGENFGKNQLVKQI